MKPTDIENLNKKSTPLTDKHHPPYFLKLAKPLIR